VVRCLSELKPAWFVGENVPGLLHLGIDQVLSDLASLGYETSVLGIPACGVDAPHIRQRLWFLSYRNQHRESALSVNDETPRLSGNMADATRLRCENSGRPCEGTGTKKERRGFTNGSRWPTEPNVDRVAHGVSHRVDRLRGLGNAIVPQIAEALGRMILEADRDEESICSQAHP
jgi:DNA (cytosine-5)-methyltransferase 1